jgi:hypothetical protein
MCFDGRTQAWGTRVLLIFFSLTWTSTAAEAQAEAEALEKLKRLSAVIGKNKEGSVESITLSLATDQNIESVDFRAFKNLTTLSLIGCEIVGDRAMKHIRSTVRPGLRNLIVVGGHPSDKELKLLLEKHSSLKHVSLRGEFVSDDLVSKIDALKELTSLFVDGPKLTDSGLKSIARIQKLEFLDVGHTGITDAGLAEIAKLKSLIGLTLTGTKVTDAGIQQLGALRQLEFLRLSRTGVTEKGKAGLKKLLPDLEFD